MEVAFGQEAYGTHFDGFMRHYLTLKTGEIPNVNAVYEAFKAHARSPRGCQTGVDALVADIHAYAGYYCAMALGKEPDKDLGRRLQDLRELKVDVAYPFLLELYHDYVDETALEAGLRSAPCGWSRPTSSAGPSAPSRRTRSTRPSPPSAARSRRTATSRASRRTLLTCPPTGAFRATRSSSASCCPRSLQLPRRSYWLRRLENHGRKERVPVDEYTIEHILPQNENLSAEWREALGPDWQRVQETWLHTLGNLTLTGYNSEYSDRPFSREARHAGRLQGEPAPAQRGASVPSTPGTKPRFRHARKRLAEQAVKVWAPPHCRPMSWSVPTQGTEKPQATPSTITRILPRTAPMRPLFETLRKKVLALDPA